MQIIKPRQISGEIMTLIEEADSKMIFISPYYDITKWVKLNNALKVLQHKKIDVEFYVRKGDNKSISEIRAINYEPICIPRLHTKLYLNESIAIVSSMNLHASSDEHSLDIALKTESPENIKCSINTTTDI
jgi:hypothetical protein